MTGEDSDVARPVPVPAFAGDSFEESLYAALEKSPRVEALGWHRRGDDSDPPTLWVRLSDGSTGTITFYFKA
jgi:hypothetical protein